MKDDIAPILRHGWANASLQQLLDLGDDLIVVFFARCCRAPRCARNQYWPASGEMLHDNGKDRRLQLVPIAVTRLCHGDEIRAKKYPRHLRERKEAFRQRGNTSRFVTSEICGDRAHD